MGKGGTIRVRPYRVGTPRIWLASTSRDPRRTVDGADVESTTRLRAGRMVPSPLLPVRAVRGRVFESALLVRRDLRFGAAQDLVLFYVGAPRSAETTCRDVAAPGGAELRGGPIVGR